MDDRAAGLGPAGAAAGATAALHGTRARAQLWTHRDADPRSEHAPARSSSLPAAELPGYALGFGRQRLPRPASALQHTGGLPGYVSLRDHDPARGSSGWWCSPTRNRATRSTPSPHRAVDYYLGTPAHRLPRAPIAALPRRGSARRSTRRSDAACALRATAHAGPVAAAGAKFAGRYRTPGTATSRIALEARASW